MKTVFIQSLFCLIFLPFVVQSQSLPRLSIEFEVDDSDLRNPLAGGLTSPQFSEVDLNNDGIMDLYAFDRVGDVSVPFLNMGTPNEVDYTFAPDYIDHFPEMEDWVLLRDYNDDGVMDIFTYGIVPDGVRVFKGYIDSDNKIAFEPFNFFLGSFNVVYYQQSNGSYTNLYITGVDYPAVDDIDGDGDLDILTFAPEGGVLELFSNQSIEMGFGTDSLFFDQADECWGKFFEGGLSTEVDLSADPGNCASPFIGDIDSRHAGSTTLSLDIDNDNDKEVVLGDIFFTNVNFLTNGGSAENAWMTAQDPLFPSYNVTVDLPIFPATFYVDIDNDGNKDFIASPNDRNSENYNVAWYYKNVEDNAFPVFELVQKNFLVDGMVDLGAGANPAFADVNGDGLLDLVVGNFKIFKPFGENDPRLFLYLNVGTATQPKFRLEDDDFLNFNDFASLTLDFAPTFGDMDNDGDLDLLVGENWGRIFYRENIAGEGNPMEFGPLEFPYMQIDVGQNSTPNVVDINRDGLPDLVIGERNGNLNYLQNTGTQNVPQIDSLPTNEFFGFVNTQIPGVTLTGYSAPFFIDIDGEYTLLTGSEKGYIERYTGIDGNLDGQFTEVTTTYGNLREGLRTHFAIADLNSDGFLDMMMGNFRGGLSAFGTEIESGVTSTNYVDHDTEIILYPNPAEGYIYLQAKRVRNQSTSIKIYDSAGKLVKSMTQTNPIMEINIAELVSGLYLIKCQFDDQVVTKKFLRN